MGLVGQEVEMIAEAENDTLHVSVLVVGRSDGEKNAEACHLKMTQL